VNGTNAFDTKLLHVCGVMVLVARGHSLMQPVCAPLRACMDMESSLPQEPAVHPGVPCMCSGEQRPALHTLAVVRAS